MILPALGVISEIIPVFARRTIFGYKFIAFSSLAIALFGSLVWAHHMFVSGMSIAAMFIFSLLTFLVSIPERDQGLQLGGDAVQGIHRAGAPMLFILSFIVQFSIGGFTGTDARRALP